MTQRVAVIGAGWAGLAAAVRATELGHAITLFEATRTPGGRARALPHEPGNPVLDNGQHILIGAYTATLGLMRRVGVSPDDVLTRMPLTLVQHDGTGLRMPSWPSWLAPLARLVGVTAANCWTWRDKLSLIRTLLAWQRRGFVCHPKLTVAELCSELAPSVKQRLIDPLCVSALNVPTQEASAAVFLRVLRDALFEQPDGSDLLIPKADLSQLLPEPALNWLSQHGATIHLGQRVTQVVRDEDGLWQLMGPGKDDAAYNEVIIATHPTAAASLLEATELSHPAVADWLSTTRALEHTAIATVYLQAQQPLPMPIVALPDGPSHPAQFAIDRGPAINPASGAAAKHTVALVVSASQGSNEEISTRCLAQAQQQLSSMGTFEHLQTVVEKRATFACTPDVQRPAPRITTGLWACGDYVAGPYPATLEGAVRSGLAVAEALPRA